MNAEDLRERFMGRDVAITWDELEEDSTIRPGGMTGTVEQIDEWRGEIWLMVDWGYAIRVKDIKTIAEVPEAVAK